jgi:hypothetical protein
MTLTVSPRPNAEGCRGSAASVLDVPLLLDNPAGDAVQPISLGIPLPRGVLTDPRRLALRDHEGQAADVQAEPLARWSDGSVKWLLLDFVLRDAPPGRSEWRLHAAATVEHASSARLHVEQSDAGVVVDTGAAVFHLGGDAALLRRALVDGADLLDEAAGRILLTDERGRQIAPRLERIEVEARGPVRATVRLQGSFPNRMRFLARLCFFAGTGFVRLRLTLHNPRRARHKGGLWDLGDPGSLYFHELAFVLGLRLSSPPSLRWTAESGAAVQTGSGPLEIYQDSSGGANWRSRNHVNRHGQVPCSFCGYRVRRGNEETFGLRASPVATVLGDRGSVTAALPEFWQQFPKALEVRDGSVRLGLFPRQFGDPFELQGGEQKTHTVWLHFGSLQSTSEAALDWVHNPTSVRLEPEWYAHCGVIPHLAPADTIPNDRLDTYLQDAVEGENNLLARREIIDEYGWRNFGEVYADHESAYYDGPRPAISHYNNQYDQVYGALLQYWRGGDRRWLELADPLARHVFDIDIYHTNEDRAAYNGGLFWFTDHYKDAAICTHRTYSRANCRAGDRSYGGGPGSSHNFTTGLLHYYYHTGEPLARDAVLSLADWVVGMDDGRRNLLGLIDDGPTGLASSTAEPEYHGPGRGAGLSIDALLDGWLISGRRDYLNKAEELIRRCIHPADDIAARHLLDVEKRWSYTVFLSALARYLSVKAEAEELDFLYAYAQASLLHYAAWMLDNERPYFDRREELEYPTEAWAGQEFRKANVLRLAAAHAEEPLRGRLLRRGQELAERAWSDLMQFDTRYSARALALLLREGTRDHYFRFHAAAPAPRSPGEHDFGAPTAFVPQKLRLRTQLRSLGGLSRALARLANPRLWLRLYRLRG